jgi:hypothetical protein
VEPEHPRNEIGKAHGCGKLWAFSCVRFPLVWASPSPGDGILRIDSNGILETVCSPASVKASSVQQGAALQIKLIGFEIARSCLHR